MTFILCQSKATAYACRLWCETSDDVTELTPLEHEIDRNSLEPKPETYQALFNRFVLTLTNVDRTDRLRILVDVFDASYASQFEGDDITPSAITSSCWSSLISSLVLAFPDADWFFGIVLGKSLLDESDRKLLDHHCFSQLNSISSSNVFDASGLRSWIRQRTNINLSGNVKAEGNRHSAFQLPVRSEAAAVIEDEEDYAMLHSYAAYRYGYRVQIIKSWHQLKKHFKSSRTKTNSHGYSLIIEDMRLQFADKDASTHLSNLRERGKECDLLSEERDDSRFRFLVTTGQDESLRVDLKDNEDFLNSHDGGRVLIKPIGGPIEFWEKSRLKHELSHLDDAEFPRGNAARFVWPPVKIMDDLYSGHAAPGKLAMVANVLLNRSRTVAGNAATPSDWLLAALLAGDAVELIGGKTPAMALDALRLKHVAEVRAECAFVGAGFHCDLTSRINELDAEIKSVCRWYKKENRKNCFWDAKATILNELINVFRDTGQMEEEDKCLHAFRKVNRKLERPKNIHRFNPLAWALHGVLAYAEFLLFSLTRILIAFAVVIVIFSLISMAVVGSKFPETPANPIFFVAKQLNWMIGGGTHDVNVFSESDLGEAQSPSLAFVSIVANIVGVFHFGILMSFLYGLISRK